MNYYFYNIKTLLSKEKHFKGWGRKKTGRLALWCQQKFGGSLTLLEDGFIRSIGLGVDSSPSFSLLEDNIGIYYDASTASKLENILNTYDFTSDVTLMKKAREAMSLIKKHHVSKYNNAPNIDDDFFSDDTNEKVLIIAQTAGDASLEYGLGNVFSTKEMIDDAIKENPLSSLYIKMHPDVLSGKKQSDIALGQIPKECIILDENVNPISLLKQFKKVYTKTSGMGMEALILGLDVVCYGMPYYAGWGLTIDKQNCKRRRRKLSIDELFAGAYILYTKYYNLYTQQPTDIIDTIKTIVKHRERDGKVDIEGYFFGFSTWKHSFISYFMHTLKKQYFIHPLFSKKHLSKALSKGLDEKKYIYIWGKKALKDIESYAKEKGMHIYRVEDGFIRSVGLGSDLTQPYSLVIDGRGIYFDPTQESDLEHILNFHVFTDEELMRAKRLREYLVAEKLSKYNHYADVDLELPKNKKIILVPGQVEDDASMYYGAKGMDNLALLQKAREACPLNYIIFKPHPDVLAGNRVGHVKEKDALLYCDQIVTDISLDSVLAHADEVHTMTSLVGFEAIMRGIKVCTYGLPFYAGWGLSIDKKVCSRRQKMLSVDELTVVVLLLYPRYIDPKTNELCEVEVVLARLKEEKERLISSIGYRLRVKIRNYISRKSQQLWRLF